MSSPSMSGSKTTDDHDFRPPLTVGRDAPYPALPMHSWRAGRGELTPRALAQHFRGRSGAGGLRAAPPVVAPGRRVVVHVRRASLGPAARQGLIDHLSYIGRDDAGADGGGLPLFDKGDDGVEARALVDRCAGDRHYFSLMVSPEDGDEFSDLKRYARQLMDRVEKDVGSSLDWVGAAHYDTGRPHLHLVVRGHCDDDRTLRLSWAYVRGALKTHAQDLATEMLGPRLQHMADPTLRANRFTPVDQILLDVAIAGRIERSNLPQAHLSDGLRRLTHLERRGWAVRDGPGAWIVPHDLRQTLQTLGRQAARGVGARQAVSGTDWADHRHLLTLIAPRPGEHFVGAFVGVGRAGPHPTGSHVVVLDLSDGRLGHFLLPDRYSVMCFDQIPPGAVAHIAASERTQRRSDAMIAEVAAGCSGAWSVALHAAARPDDTRRFIAGLQKRVEAMSREGACEALGSDCYRIPATYREDAAQIDVARLGPAELRVRLVDHRTLEEQIRAPGLTWLDGVLASNKPIGGSGRFGAALTSALRDRTAQMRMMRLGAGDPWRLSQDDLNTLRVIDVKAVFESLGKEGKAVFVMKSGEQARGAYSRRVFLAGAPYAALEGRTMINLAPWKPGMEYFRGQNLAAVVQNGVTDFRGIRDLGRDFGLG